MLKTKQKGIPEILGLVTDINTILDLNWDNFISYQKVLEWPINEKRNIEGVINLKILHTDTHCRFLTAIPPLKSFNIHWHDCLEVCTVLAGTLGDKEIQATYPMGTKCEYLPFQKHIPYNPSETEFLYLLVDFMIINL